MRIRPSAVAPSNNNKIQQGICPSCSASEAASIGVESGNCPSCGNPIPAEPSAQQGMGDDTNVRIL